MIYIAFLFILAIADVRHQEKTTLDPRIEVAPQEKIMISNEHDAIKRAVALVGATPTEAASATQEVVTNDQTPFLHASVNQSSVWNVRLPKTVFAPCAGQVETEKIQLNLLVRIFAATGSLISIESEWPEAETQPWEYPGAEQATTDIHRGGKETWHAFLEAGPKLTLKQVLDTMQGSFGGVSECKQIKAHCVMWSMMNRRPRPAWSVHLRGLPPWQPMNAGGPSLVSSADVPDVEPSELPESDVPANFRNHMRHIVYDDTNTWYKAGTNPQPVPPGMKMDVSTATTRTSGIPEFKAPSKENNADKENKK
jgi:hypothetical protein